MNRNDKIKFLKEFSKGITSFKTIKPISTVIIYHTDVFRIGNKSMNEVEVKAYTEGMKAAVYLPENFR